jgi:GH24 family phage-related lysozyme (muramidase)
VRNGEQIGEVRARLYLMWHMENQIKPRLERMAHWTMMNPNQRAAIYSFAYNLGAGFYHARNFTSISTLCDSPLLWNDGEFVRHQFGKYVRAGGKTLAGLVRRRTAEASLFLTPV